MSRSAQRRKPIGDRFGYIPLDVLESIIYQRLSYAHRHLLLCIAAQFNGNNNGNLTFTRQDGERFGFHSEDTRYKGLKQLETYGLIFKTHQGGLDHLGANRYGLPWARLNYRDGRELPVPLPARGWVEKQIEVTTPRSAPSPICGDDNPSTVTTPRSAKPKSSSPRSGEHLDSGQGRAKSGSEGQT